MPDYSKTPVSTMNDHYDFNNKMIPPISKRLHLQKNDFSEHTEQGLSVMKALISDKA